MDEWSQYELINKVQIIDTIVIYDDFIHFSGEKHKSVMW